MSIPSRKRRGTAVKVPKEFVISFRVNAQEWKALKEHSQHSGTSLSKLLRANLALLLHGENR